MKIHIHTQDAEHWMATPEDQIYADKEKDSINNSDRTEDPA